MAANSAAEKPSFRWLDLARYVVASVVTVLIVAVICNAIKVILRPETMYVSVPGGSVPATSLDSPPPPPPSSATATATATPAPRVAFAINLRTENPSGRAVMYYVNSTVYLFDKNTTESTTNPKDDSIVYFHVNDVALLQGGAVDSILRVSATKAQMIPFYFDLLHGGNNGSSNQIAGVTLRLDGVLITEAVSGSNRTGRPTTYYCRELLVGGDPDDEAFKGRPDVTCSGVMQASSSSSSTSHNHVLSWLFYYMLVASMVALIHQTL